MQEILAHIIKSRERLYTLLKLTSLLTGDRLNPSLAKSYTPLNTLTGQMERLSVFRLLVPVVHNLLWFHCSHMNILDYITW